MIRNMRIGDLAKITGCRAETIRFYEREGLLKTAARSGNNYRLYGAEHAERLRFIRHCRSLDMTLGEIRALLACCDAPERNCAEVSELLDEHIRHVAERISELRELEKRLKTLRRQCMQSGAAKHCGILSGLISGRADCSIARRSGAGHVRGSHSGKNRAA